MKRSKNRQVALIKKKDAIKIADEPFIGSWSEAPKHSQDNEYILRGYRVNFNTTKRILKSLFMIHNETTNIWSHLAGMLLFIVFITYVGLKLSPLFTFKTFDELKEMTSNKWNQLFNSENR